MGEVCQECVQCSPWIAISLCLPAVAQLYNIFSWLAIWHQVIITEITIVVTTHTTYLPTVWGRENKGEKQ